MGCSFSLQMKAFSNNFDEPSPITLIVLAIMAKINFLNKAFQSLVHRVLLNYFESVTKREPEAQLLECIKC